MLASRPRFSGIQPSAQEHPVTTPSGTIEFNCACGKNVRARVDQGGRSYDCPACGASLKVPKVALRPAAVGKVPTASAGPIAAPVAAAAAPIIAAAPPLAAAS